MDDDQGRFVWYELLTTDVAAAKTFYADVVGWGTQDASTTDFPYGLFVAGAQPLCGVMDLPAEARRMGATPRWVGYVGVADVDAMATRLKRLGGTVYVPPTDSNIGRISIVADPQTTSFALVEGLKPRPPRGVEEQCVGWHELLAADWQSAFGFYSELFGWKSVSTDAASAMDSYQLFSCGGRTIGGMFTKLPRAPFPFWLYYFNVADIGVAAKRVQAGGGRIMQGPVDMPDGTAIMRCTDPQGAMFALQGARGQEGAGQTPTAEFGWAADWGGFASRGRLIAEPKAPAKPGTKSQATPSLRPGAPAKR